MLPNDVVLFGFTLGFALIILFKWKRRRMLNARRVNRGLRGYVSGKPVATADKDQELTAA
jgi:hypothetical protein